MSVDWNCSNCWTDNPPDTDICQGCGQPRYDENLVGIYEQDRVLQKLMGGLNFTSEDIFHNRRGEISPRQKRTLRRKRIGNFLGWLFIGVFIVLTVVLVMQSDRFVVWFVVFGTIVGLTVYFVGAFLSQKATPKPEFPPPFPRRIIRIQGKLSKGFDILYSKRRSVPIHYIKIGDFELRMSRDLYDVFSNDQAYALYLVSDTRRIVAAEPISDGNLNGAAVVDNKRVLDDSKHDSG